MKKTILKDKPPEQYSDLIIFAISSAESDLKICMLINKILKINLSLAADFELTIRNRSVRFRKYSWEDEEVEEKISLYVNRNEGHFLIPELRKIDYILVIQTEANLKGMEHSLQLLKNEPEVTVLSKLNPASLRSLSKIL